MAHLYRALVSLRTLILAGTLSLAVAGGFVAHGSSAAGAGKPQGGATAQAAAETSCLSGAVITVPYTYLVKEWTIGSAACAR